MHNNVRKKLALALGLPAGLYLFAVGFALSQPSPYGRCDFYNRPDTLDAGIKIIDGEQYTIQVCGTGGNDQDSSDDQLELQVFSSQGELLAKRHYAVNWYASNAFHEPIEYKNNKIIYTNSQYEKNEIQMPTTKLDWLQARIPFVN